MWSVARHDIGLSSEEFFALRPVEFGALCDRLTRSREHRELLFAQLTAYLVNTSFYRPEKPVEIKSFMPSHWGVKERKVPKRRKRLTDRDHQEIANSFRRLMEELGAK